MITEKLCSEEFFGRGYLNDGMQKAAFFLQKEFESYGLKPISQEFDYLQNYFYSVNTFPGEINVVYNERKLLPGIHYIVDPASPNSEKIIYCKVLDSIDFSDEEKLLQSIASMQYSKENGFLINSINSSDKSATLNLAYQLSSIAPVVYLTNEKFTWSVSQYQLQNPIIFLQDSILKQLEDEMNISSFQVKIEADFIPNFQASNVIGYLPSSRKKLFSKTIIFCAHYDHLGGMGNETYFPGANDNASGTAMICSLAKYFAINPSRKHNLLFIAFSGEEAGLIGSSYFVDNCPIKLNRIRMVLNLDIMGSGEEGITVVNATEYPKEFNKLVSINEKIKLLSVIKKRGVTQNSDHYPFHEKGIPSFFIYTMGQNKNYHDVFDIYDSLTFEAYDAILSLLKAFVAQI